MKLKEACSLEERLWQIWQHIKKQRHHFADKGPYGQSYSFSSDHVQMWQLDHKSWAAKNWFFQTVVLEKTLESPLDSKEIKPVNSKRKSTLNIHRKKRCLSWSSNTLAKDAKSDSVEETLMLGKIEGKREGDERGWDGWMASWLNGHESEQTPGDSEGQGSLACWVHGVAKIWTWLRNWTTRRTLGRQKHVSERRDPGKRTQLRYWIILGLVRKRIILIVYTFVLYNFWSVSICKYRLNLVKSCLV